MLLVSLRAVQEGQRTPFDAWKKESKEERKDRIS